MTYGTKRLVIAAVLAALAVGAPASAQSPRATLHGTVRDGTGAVMPGVTITATSQAGNISQTTTSGADGTYSLAVPPGKYTLTATLSGFRRVTRQADVAANGSEPIDLTLEVMLSEEVIVTATKRESELIDVPFSIAAPTAEVLRERGAETLEGVAANVGGFTVQNLGPGQSQVAIRGVSAGQIVRDQPGVKEQVGVYLDESVDLAVAVHARHRSLRHRCASKCCAAPRARCSAPAPNRARSATSRTSRS